MKRSKSKSSKRTYRRKHDPDKLVQAWKKSGLKKSEFCRKRGIANSILYRAIRDGHGNMKPKPSPFIHAVVEAGAGRGAGGASIEFPNGIIVRIDNLTAGVFDLIREL